MMRNPITKNDVEDSGRLGVLFVKNHPLKMTIWLESPPYDLHCFYPDYGRKRSNFSQENWPKKTEVQCLPDVGQSQGWNERFTGRNEVVGLELLVEWGVISVGKWCGGIVSSHHHGTCSFSDNLCLFSGLLHSKHSYPLIS